MALWRPGDTVQVKLLPEATKDALRWCELNSKSRVVMVNDVTPDLFEFITVMVKELHHLCSEKEEVEAGQYLLADVTVAMWRWCDG